MKNCKVENCNNIYLAKGYCIKHYQQFKNHGKILTRTRFDPNEIINYGDYYEVCLYNVKHEEISRVLIDKEDLDKIKNYKWHLNSNSYVSTNKSKKIIFLHRLIMGKPSKIFDIDHINHNTLDNRKQNLRIVTHQQNGMNQKSKGYCFNKRYKKWETYIHKNYKKIFLGYFINEQDAINARRNAELKYFGEFAPIRI